MTFRAKLLASATMLALAGLVSNHARAGLLGAGNTVQAFYYNGVFASPEGEIPVGGHDATRVAGGSRSTTRRARPTDRRSTSATPRSMITNLLSGAPFCFANTAGTACTD